MAWQAKLRSLKAWAPTEPRALQASKPKGLALLRKAVGPSGYEALQAWPTS